MRVRTTDLKANLKAVALALMLSALGCGGSGSSNSGDTSKPGSFKMTVQWPKQSRLVTARTKRIRVFILPGHVANQLRPDVRPTDLGGSVGEVVGKPGQSVARLDFPANTFTIAKLPGAGQGGPDYTIVAQGFPDTQPVGSENTDPVTLGSAEVSIDWGEEKQFSILMGSNVEEFDVRVLREDGTSTDQNDIAAGGNAQLDLGADELVQVQVRPKFDGSHGTAFLLLDKIDNATGNNQLYDLSATDHAVTSPMTSLKENNGTVWRFMVAAGDVGTGSFDVSYSEDPTKKVTIDVGVTAMSVDSKVDPNDVKWPVSIGAINVLTDVSALPSGNAPQALGRNNANTAYRGVIDMNPANDPVGGNNLGQAYTTLGANTRASGQDILGKGTQRVARPNSNSVDINVTCEDMDSSYDLTGIAAVLDSFVLVNPANGNDTVRMLLGAPNFSLGSVTFAPNVANSTGIAVGMLRDGRQAVFVANGKSIRRYPIKTVGNIESFDTAVVLKTTSNNILDIAVIGQWTYALLDNGEVEVYDYNGQDITATALPGLSLNNANNKRLDVWFNPNTNQRYVLVAADDNAGNQGLSRVVLSR